MGIDSTDSKKGETVMSAKIAVETINRKSSTEGPHHDDFVLVAKVRDGDRKAFSELVRKHQKGVLRLAVRFMKDMDAAEDVAQETFIKAFEKISSFEGRASFKSWLFQIAVNTARNKLRERRDGMTDFENVPLAVSARAESSLVHGVIAELIHKHVDALPFKQRTALMLRIYEDLSFKEIAEIMQCPYDTAKANYRHALLKMKDELSQHQDLKGWAFDMDGVWVEMSQSVEAEV